VKEVEQLGATGHFAGEGELSLFAEGVDGAGFACIGAPGEDDFGDAGCGTFDHFGGRNFEVGVVVVDAHGFFAEVFDKSRCL
jgi:hypothetical protein